MFWNIWISITHYVSISFNYFISNSVQFLDKIAYCMYFIKKKQQSLHLPREIFYMYNVHKEIEISYLWKDTRPSAMFWKCVYRSFNKEDDCMEIDFYLHFCHVIHINTLFNYICLNICFRIKRLPYCWLLTI
jgi:hypothetical protein